MKTQHEKMMDLDANGIKNWRDMNESQIEASHSALIKKKQEDEYAATEKSSREKRHPSPNGDPGTSPSM